MTDEIKDLKLIVTEDRMADVDLATVYNLENQSPRAVVDFVAHFVVNGDGKWLPHDEAVARVLEGRKLKDITPIAEQLQEEMELMAVPKE